ncbi:MAG: alpha/beta hydrolase [Candidatus Eremiobacteraeota bacterium]|nr:alpha/beta hydrolase [Candidatus Eremiobacteraeota bacterium]
MMPMLPAQDQKADADMQLVLDQLAAFHAPKLPTVTPRIARELPSFADALQGALSAQGKPSVEAVAMVTHKVIEGPAGPLLLRIYTPQGTAPFPVVLYYHGGGFVIANLDTYDASPRSLANGTGAIVVSVAYRQAPEFPFPAAPDDAFAAYRWVLANAASIGGDPKRVAVAGESAGGNLATVVTMRAMHHNAMMPLHQLLVYPVTNFVKGPPPPSYTENPTTIPLATPDLTWFGKYYLATPSQAMNPLASPLHGALAGMSPATIINADLDPLRDDGATYAGALKAAGVKVTRTVYRGVTHEFFGMGAAVAKAKSAMQEGATALKSALST